MDERDRFVPGLTYGINFSDKETYQVAKSIKYKKKFCFFVCFQLKESLFFLMKSIVSSAQKLQWDINHE